MLTQPQDVVCRRHLQLLAGSPNVEQDFLEEYTEAGLQWKGLFIPTAATAFITTVLTFVCVSLYVFCFCDYTQV